MKELQSILGTGIEVVERKQEKKKQKDKIFKLFPDDRSNDRKNTRSRKTQRIFCVDSSTWPIKTYWKHIKHPAK